MIYLLDTNICIFLIKEHSDTLMRRLCSKQVGEVALSSVTVSELRYGVAKSKAVEKNRAALEKFLLPLEILPFDAEAAIHYGPICAELEAKGTPIGAMDLMIAAHAKAVGAILVTNNLREFTRVPDLRAEDWTQEG